MPMPPELIEHYGHALTAARAVLVLVRPSDLARPTPCEGWDLRMLTAHMIGQNEGFATALVTGDAEASAYAPRPAQDSDALLGAWDDSVKHLLAAVDGCDSDRRVRLVEIAPDATFAATAVVEMQLLDTVIHTWDVATALGERYRPDQPLLELVAAGSLRVPDGQVRTRPGAAFAPSLTTAMDDPWALTLARLGRSLDR